MSWLLFYLLAALHPVAFIVIGLASKTWRQRLVLWALLPIPAVFYCWDYFVIESEHEQMCAAEGGLKVLIQPEKVDRVRLVGDRFRHSSMDMLEAYYPRLKVVEGLQAKEVDANGRPLTYYVSYTATPNPKVGQSEKGSRPEGKLIFSATRVEVLVPDLYEFSEQEFEIPHGTKTEMTLSKGGKVYAKHTDLVHWWTGIRYPDALPTWRCPDRSQKVPPKDEPYAPHDKWRYPPFAHTALFELILK